MHWRSEVRPAVRRCSDDRRIPAPHRGLRRGRGRRQLGLRKHRRRVGELDFQQITADGDPVATVQHHPVAPAHRPIVHRRRIAAHVDQHELPAVELDPRLHTGNVPLGIGQDQLIAILPPDRPAPAVEIKTCRTGRRGTVEADYGDSHGGVVSEK